MAKRSRFCKTSKEIQKLPDGKRERAQRLLEKAIFMEDQLQELQEILKTKGWTEEYQNGENQRGVKKSSEADVYNTLTKNFLATMKQLDEMASQATPDDGAAGGLMDFLSNR